MLFKRLLFISAMLALLPCLDAQAGCRRERVQDRRANGCGAAHATVKVAGAVLGVPRRQARRI